MHDSEAGCSAITKLYDTHWVDMSYDTLVCVSEPKRLSPTVSQNRSLTRAETLVQPAYSSRCITTNNVCKSNGQTYSADPQFSISLLIWATQFLIRSALRSSWLSSSRANPQKVPSSSRACTHTLSLCTSLHALHYLMQQTE